MMHLAFLESDGDISVLTTSSLQHVDNEIA